MSKEKLTGTIEYYGNEITFNGATDLPVKAVTLYLLKKPYAAKKDIETYFGPGLKGDVNNFIIEANNLIQDNRDRFKVNDELEFFDNAGNKKKFYISSQFGYTGDQANLPHFISYIKTKGYTVNILTYPDSKIAGYNIIDINQYPILQELRDKLFSKNPDIIALLKSMDTCGQLETLDEDDSMLLKTISNANYIKFSTDTPSDKFGKYNRYDLIKDAAELASKIENSSLSEDIKSTLLELLERFLRNRQNNNENSKQILDRIKDVLKDVNNKDYKDIFDGVSKLEKTIGNLIFKSSIYGKYIKKERVIIIFLNNILFKHGGNEQFSLSELYDFYPTINKDIERTYVHELFHMIHFSQDREVADGDYGYKVVIEGLARYFEIYYSEKYLGTNAQNELDALSSKHSILSYPYVGACYMERPVISLWCGGFGMILRKSFEYDDSPCHLGLHCLLQGTHELETIISNLKNSF